MTARSISPRSALQVYLPRIVLAPSFALILLFVYGFIIFTASCPSRARRSFMISRHGSASTTTSACSTTRTGSPPSRTSRSSRHFTSWSARSSGWAWPSFSTRDQGRGRAAADLPLSDGALLHRHRRRVGSGFLDPASGLEHVVQSWGWESFSFRWIKDGKMAIYTIVIAPIWQSSGFVMAMFLAGFAESTTRSSRLRRSTARRTGRSTAGSSFR